VALALPSVAIMGGRHHHEEIAAASSLWPALSLLIPFSAALWARMTARRSTEPAARQTDNPGR
jgi:hypothetical protein